MIYKEKVKMTQEEINYYADLLGLDLDKSSLNYNEHDIERLGAKTDDYINIRTIEFKNGNYVSIDLASGNSNYYDNIVLYDKKGYELYCSDCNFKINSFSLFYEEDIYDIELVVD